jgi:hypothetical protein
LAASQEQLSSMSECNLLLDELMEHLHVLPIYNYMFTNNNNIICIHRLQEMDNESEILLNLRPAHSSQLETRLYFF